MTSLLVAVSLILTPSPIQAPQSHQGGGGETVQQRAVGTAALLDPIVVWTDSALTLTFDGPAPTTTTIPPPPVWTPIEQGMSRLTELGATPYQLRVFGCLAWFESKNNPYAVSVTGDYGLWQINRRFHAWRWAGRDIYDPTVNAEVAFDIYRESGWRAWTTHALCGV